MTKSPDAFRTISEVAEILETPAHVLRFWESRFPQIKPVKRAGGRRYYRPEDLALLSGIRRLLHDEGLTIRGVQKVLREQGVRYVSGIAEDEEADFLADVIDATPVKSSAPIPLFPQPAETAPETMQDPAPEPTVVKEASSAPELPFPEPLRPAAADSKAAEATQASQEIEVTAKDTPRPLPPPFPETAEIHTHWLATDLRRVRKDAFVGKTAEAAAIFQRLKALRNRVGDLGRVPRR
ncbi:MerR family transcriptional regulator [Pseudorhodobacter aquimaris]|uniref:MerR family transcriptional regulator n=1 Tax=Pseudorhodobacter aquimaris TaxID=687412 RepID=UPI0009F85B91|nr:MerR family transcriptional regulator [Pseudorhodobacter aquimaris]